MENLRSGPYGRCVFRSDNDVVDHQVVSLEFDGGITASFSMQAHTSYAGRRIRIMGSNGDLVGDEQTLSVVDFGTDRKTEWNARDIADLDSGHGGGDYGLVRDWVQAVSQHNPSMLATDIGTAMESHLMGFRAEESRLRGELRTLEAVG
jgi:predicted dehydrogenase